MFYPASVIALCLYTVIVQIQCTHRATGQFVTTSVYCIMPGRNLRSFFHNHCCKLVIFVSIFYTYWHTPVLGGFFVENVPVFIIESFKETQESG